MQAEVIHPEAGPLLLTSRAGLRRITLTVRRDGVVRLSFPSHVGRERALAFLESKMEWLRRAKARIAARQETDRHTIDAEEVARLRQAAKEELPARVAHLSAVTGLHCTGVRISSARTRWGSCSAKNHLSLSLYLMRLPEHLRDFIILHELCHTIHHNHSPRFHRLLNELLGGREASLQKELRAFRIG